MYNLYARVRFCGAVVQILQIPNVSNWHMGILTLHVWKDLNLLKIGKVSQRMMQECKARGSGQLVSLPMTRQQNKDTEDINQLIIDLIDS